MAYPAIRHAFACLCVQVCTHVWAWGWILLCTQVCTVWEEGQTQLCTD